MLGWLFLLAFALACAIFAWLKGRPAEWVFPSDSFFILTVLLMGTVPFVNLYAETELYGNFHYSDDAVRRTLICLALMFMTMSFVWMLRPKIRIPDLLPGNAVSRMQDQRQAEPMLWILSIAMVLISVLLFAVPLYLSYKIEILNFLTAQTSASDYREARRVIYADADGLMGRLRFGVFPALFVGLSIVAIRRFGLIAGIAISALVFVVGPASLSKAPIVYYTLYFTIAALLMRGVRWPMRMRNFAVSLAIGLPALLLTLSLIYFLQYGGAGGGSWSLPDALDLAYFRIFVAPYDGVLKYVTAFGAGDVGVSGLPLVAGLFGEPVRNLDVEVAVHFLGGRRGIYTSYPTIFIANAYASFGYLGVVIYSALVAWFLYLVDKAFVSIRNSDLRIVFYSVMTVNVLFFAILSAPTALLTYGGAILPLMVLAADRLIAVPKRRRALA